MNITPTQVDEDALLGTDDLDDYDPDIKEFTASLGLNTELDVDLSFAGGQGTDLTSKGEDITFELSNDKNTMIGKAGTREVFEITLNEENGTYTFTLKDVVDHPDTTSEDLINNIGFQVIAKTGSSFTGGTINVSIADDIPTAGSVVIEAESDYDQVTTNLVLAIDTSASMGSGVGSRLELAKESAIKLIEKYEQMGDVNVKIIEFNSDASSTLWFTDSTDAKNSISDLSAYGYTNYEDTLRETMDNYNEIDDPKPNSDQNIFYMISDGNPTQGDMNGTDNISGLVPEWIEFAENNFNDVYSIGIGTDVDIEGNNKGSLYQIADLENGHDAFIVEDVNDLTDELLSTIINVNGVLIVNSGDNELDFSFGADGPADGTGPKLDADKLSFTWGDVDSSDGLGIIINNDDGTGPSIEWTIYSNGKIILGKDLDSNEIVIKLEANNVNSDNPTYDVTQFVPNTGINKIEIPFTVVDGDGDGASANLSIDIESDFSAFIKLTGDSTVTEEDGAQLIHNIQLVDQNSDPINLRAGQKVTVELEYTNDTTESEDFENPKTVIVEIVGNVNGNSTAQIINTISDDLLNEGTEGYTLSIKDISTNVSGLGTITAHETNGTKDSVTGSITDDVDSITATITGDTAIDEGNDSSYLVQLKDANDNPVVVSGDKVVTLEYSYVNTTTSEDIVEKVNVTIPDGESEIAFDISTIDDGIYEIDETFKIKIVSIDSMADYENLIIDDTPVSTAIIDNDDLPEASDKELEATCSATGKTTQFFTLADYANGGVKDESDDIDSLKITQIRIDTLPEDGTLFYQNDNNEMIEITQTMIDNGLILDETTNLEFVATEGLLANSQYGTMEDTGTLSQWGTMNSDGVLNTDDGLAVITAYDVNGQTSVGFASENNNHNHDGLGLGVVGSSDDDQIELLNEEKIVIEFKDIVSNAEFGLASLGGHFTPGASQDAYAHWEAFKDGELVSSDNIKQSTDDNNDTTNSFSVDVEFDKIVFTTTANVNSNYSIQYMNIDYKADTSFDYTAIDSDGNIGESASVTIDIHSCKPIANDDTFTTAEDTTLTGTLVTNDTLSLDGDNEYSLTLDPENGTVVINSDGTFTYTPETNYNGADSFTYTITDADGDTSSATVNLTISPDSQAQIETITSDTKTEGNSLVHTVTLDKETEIERELDFDLALGSVNSSDIGELTFSNNVTYDESTGKITIPIGVQSFTITTPTIDDSDYEENETYTLTIDGNNATGTIEDNDPNTVVANDDGIENDAQGVFTVSDANGASNSQITQLSDGGFIVVWDEYDGSTGSWNPDNGGILNNHENNDVMMQRYDSNGDLVGSAITVSSEHDDTNSRDQHSANVVELDNGNILVTWTANDMYVHEDANDGGSRYIQGKIFDENGNAICQEFTIARAGYDPIVALPDGGFVVTWSASSYLTNGGVNYSNDNPMPDSEAHEDGEFSVVGYGIFAQQYDAYGNTVGDAIQVNTTVNGDQIDSDIVLVDGKLVMTWQSETSSDSNSFDIHTQDLTFGENGLEIIGSNDQVIANTNDNEIDPQITVLSNSNVVVTWTQGSEVVAKILDSNGNEILNETLISVDQSNAKTPEITSLSNGAFIITWASEDNIYAQKFNEDGEIEGSIIELEVGVSLSAEPSISVLNDGGYIISWHDEDGVHAQRFNEDGTEYKQLNISLDEDTSITISVEELMSNDIDPEEHNFEITSVSNPTNGTVELNDTNNDGVYDSVTFTPNVDYNGPATFDYTITDELNAISKATVHLDVKPIGEPSVLVGTLCDADVKGTNVIVDEGEEAILAVRVSGAEENTTLSLSLSDGTAISSDYSSTLYYAFVDENTDMNNITWIEYSDNVNVPQNASTMIVKTNTIEDNEIEGNELYNLTATLSTGESGIGSVTIVNDDVNSVIANDDYGYNETAQGEFEVAAFDENKAQSEPDITSLSDGGFAIVWTEQSGSSYNGAVVNDLNNDGDVSDSGETVWATRQNYDVFIQRYDSDGEAVSEATRVNTFVENVNEEGGRSQHSTNVIGLSNGNILVTWSSNDHYIDQDNYDNGSVYIQGQIFDENGNAICSEFTIARAEYDPIVALPDGGFIVTWSADARLDNTDGSVTNNAEDNPISSDVHDGSGFGVVAQRFDAFGNEVGERLLVNQTVENDQIDTDIIMIDEDTAIMTWQSQNGTDGDFDIHAQTLNLTQNGLEIVSNSDIIVASGSADQTNPEITALNDGTAVITYESDSSIMLKTVSSDGTVGDEIQVSTNASNPVISALALGFVVAYEEDGAIFAKTFDGTDLSDAVQISGDTSNQTLSSITSLEDGGYVIAWQDDNGISAHRYNEDGSEFIQNNYDLDEDTSITISVEELMSNDIDPEEHNFEITSVSNPTNGTVELNDTNNDGVYDSVTFTPNVDYNGPATFDYTITDELNAISKATVHLDVKPIGEPSVLVGTLCDADVKGTNVIVDEGEEAILAVRVSGAEENTTLSLSLSDGTAISSDYSSTLYYAFVDENTDMNNITWIEYSDNVNVPQNASTMIVKTNTIEDNEIEGNELYNLTATLSTGESGIGSVTVIDDNSPEADDKHIDIDCENDDKVINITFVVDVSSSMSDTDLTLTENSIKSLVEKYEEEGTLNINIIQTWGAEGSNGEGISVTGWNSSDITVDLLNDKSGTDFDQGLKATVSAYENVPEEGTNIVYFFADGNTYGSYEESLDEYLSPSDGSTSQWEQFIASKNVELHTIGINIEDGSSLADLERIAEPSDIETIYVEDLDDLEAVVTSISTTSLSSVEFSLKDYVRDIEDDLDSTIVKVKITSLPTNGLLTVDGNDVQIGDIYDETSIIKYTPNEQQNDTLYGTTADVGTIDEWGTITNGVLTTDDNLAVIKAYSDDVLGEVGFASENNNHNHDGLGLGVVGSTDDDQIELEGNEKIVIEFNETVTNAEFGLASLGSHFTPGASQDAYAHWIAKDKDGNVVASGDVKQSTDDENSTTNSFEIDVAFDSIEFTTTANVNSNYSIQYMNVDYKIDDSFDYIAIDSDGNESVQATVTFDIDTSGNCIITTPDINSVPTVSVEATVTNIIIIENTNVENTNAGYVVSALNPDGTASTISKVFGTSHDGFGVSGISSGAETEIGYDQNEGSETLKVEFENEISSVDVDFAWKHNVNGGEHATIEFYKDGVLIDSQEQYDPNHTDGVDEGYILKPTNNESFDEIRFLAMGVDDDYLVNKIEYTEVITSDTEIRVNDDNTIDFKITTDATATLIVSEIVAGVTITDGTNNFTATDNLNSIDVFNWNYSSLQLIIPDEMETADYELIVTASNGGTPVSTTFNLEIVNNTSYVDDEATAPTIDISLDSVNEVIETTNSGLVIDAVDQIDSLSSLANIITDATYSTNNINSNYYATNNDDQIDVKNNADNSITTYSGDDKVYIGKDASTIDVGAGNDQVYVGKDAKNTIYLGDGNNDLEVANDAKVISANNGNDTVKIGNNATNTISLGEGNNSIEIKENAQGTITTGNGNDTVSIGNNAAQIDVGGGDDIVRISNDAENTITLGDGNNQLDVGGDAKVISATNGNDLVHIVGNATNTIDLGSGVNQLHVEGEAQSTIYTGNHKDTIVLEKDSAAVSTGDGDDKLDIGIDANGTIDVGNGSDMVRVANDTKSVVYLGEGNNQLQVGNDAKNAISAGSGNDTIRIDDDAESTITLGDGYNRLEVGDDTKSIIGGNSVDEINIGTKEGIDSGDLGGAIDTKEGDDIVRIQGDAVGVVTLGGGADQLYVGDDITNSINAGTGDDLINIGGKVDGTVDLGDGNDQMSISQSAKTIYAGNGNDTITIGLDAEGGISLGEGNDYLRVGGNTKSTVYSDNGNDRVIIEGNTKNVVSTGEGDDYLEIQGDMEANVTLGNGNDVLKVDGEVKANIYADGGNDVIYLNVSENEYNNDTTLQNRIQGFATIVFNDNTYIGDASLVNKIDTINSNSTVNTVAQLDPIADINWGESISSTRYEYPINLIVKNNDSDSETISEVKLSSDDLPDDAKVYQNGTEILANNNEYILDASDLSDMKITTTEEILDENGFVINVTATSTENYGGDTQSQSVNTLFIGDENDDDTIDISSAINNRTDIDIVNITGNNSDTKLDIDIEDLVADADEQLIIKGDFEGKVDLDDGNNSVKSWENSGTENIDGVNYNVYQGVGVNSTIKLLIEDDIDVTPDI